jgi:ornithine cyclodeaminase/alanine dehydrogenase-like protein (mu-crystallin family)
VPTSASSSSSSSSIRVRRAFDDDEDEDDFDEVGMALYLTEADVEELLPMEVAMGLVEAAFRQLGRGRATNHPRRRARVPNGALHVLFAAQPDAGVMGLKAYTTFRGGARFHVLLYSAEDGSLLALIEADRLGQIRTGAASGVATRSLARAEAAVAAVLGTGYQARTQLEAVARARTLAEARCFGRDPERRRRFAEEMSARLGLPVRATDSARAAVEGAAVVVTVTTSPQPVLHGEWLSPGVHVNAAGSNSLLKSELDEEVVRRADLVVVDSREHVLLEGGDLLAPLEKGILYREGLRELGEVVSGCCRGRVSDDQITLFKSHGIALEDIAVAAHVYRAARAAGRGQPIGGAGP